jgi:uncharacterized membrane protein YhhN
MSLIWLLLVMVIAIPDWVAIAKGWNRIEYFAKPAVMVALLLWVWSTVGWQAGMVWFYLGLVFSLSGDVLLMLPREQFIGGLVAFLLAHVAYVIGLSIGAQRLGVPDLASVILIGMASGGLYRSLAGSMVKKGQPGLRLPVLVYATAISLMVLTASRTLSNPAWVIAHSLLACLGALLFYLSDAVLAWNRFVSPVGRGHLIVMVMYHLGQIALVTGAALHLAG